jgi:hypothetical protein
MMALEKLGRLLDWLERFRLLYDLLAVVIEWKTVKAALTHLTTIPPDVSAAIAWGGAAVLVVILHLFVYRHIKSPAQSSLTGSSQNVRSNALMRSGSFEPGTFDSANFFRLAYYSVLQDEVANSFRAEADKTRPHEKESFYLDVLSVGAIAYGYELIWWPLFRSQLLALLSLNGHNGILPKSTFLSFYEEAAKSYPAQYSSFTFENWMHYFESNLLLKVHPSEMVEITIKGKDFLKYLLHTGRSPESKRL